MQHSRKIEVFTVRSVFKAQCDQFNFTSVGAVAEFVDMLSFHFFSCDTFTNVNIHVSALLL